MLFYMFLLGNLDYSDDTAMARCVVRSILASAGYNERDMAHRCTDELPLLAVSKQSREYSLR